MIKDKNIVILGGGTAGWLTALFSKLIFKDCNITLIESKKVGILGAGEGSTPTLVKFLKELGINRHDLLKQTGGTLKNGICFENWNGDNEKYFHSFQVRNELDRFHIPPIFGNDCYNFYLKHLINNNKKIDNHTYPPILSYDNKIDINNMSNSYHFDAHKLAEYLKNIGIERGIKLHYDEYKNVDTDEHNNITQLNFESGFSQKCDFVFDCSGFHRLLIQKHYQTKWTDYQKHLPIKKAIPFFLKQEEKIKPYTQAIAMKYGWVWKIPLQHRYGAGYIFDSDYITEEQAFNEVKEVFPDIEYIRTINFNAGRFEKVWNNNCIAVGLSSGFTEPLEATSIWLAIEQLYHLLHFLPDMFDNNTNRKKLYNDLVTEDNDSVLNFLYFHYLTKRNDSPFWKEFRDKNKPPPKIESVINDIKNSGIKTFDLHFGSHRAMFTEQSYLQVGDGLGIFDKKFKLDPYTNLYPQYKDYRLTVVQHLHKAMDHTDFLKSL
jgi:tryptophan halogenase